MKLLYEYNNGRIKTHTTFINRNTIDREKGDATRCNIFKIHTRYSTEEKREYITTLTLD